MGDVTVEQKIEFIRQLFPKRSYSFSELAIWFCCSKANVKYWIELYNVPTIKITGSPFVLQESLINMILAADAKNRSEERRCGLDFVIEDINKTPK